VNVKVVPLKAFFTLLDFSDTSPLALVKPESLSPVAPLQRPDTVAPSTGAPSPSTIFTSAMAFLFGPALLKP
jgi:hypothetical protein